MFILSVSIGRNIGAHPMSDSAWDVFQRLTRDVVCEIAPHIETHHGVGFYDHIFEDSAIITGRIDHAPDADELTRVIERAGRVGEIFAQDCVAITVGESTLIGGVA